MAAVAGKHFDAVQGGDNAALDAAFVESLVALEGAVDMPQHLLESGQVEPAQTVPQHIIAQRPRGADPVLEGGLGQIGLPLLETAESEEKAMKDGQKDGLGREVRIGASVAQVGGEAPKIEDLAEVAGKGRQLVAGAILLSDQCKIDETTTCASPPSTLSMPLSACVPGGRSARGATTRD